MSRRAAPVALLAGLAAVPAVLLAGTWQYADSQVPAETTTTTTTVAPAPPTPELATDLLSLRRHPQSLADQAAVAATESAQRQQAEALTKLIGPGSCAHVASADAVLAAVNADVPVIPASNEKLFVAAVALDVLGIDYRFRTELQSVVPDAAGAVNGDVYLVGGGDPVLRTADIADPQRHPAINVTALEPLADQLVELGVTTINGDVVGDGSRYDDEFRVDEWGPSIGSGEAGPYDALLVNDGLISAENYGLEPNRAAARTFLDLLLARGIVVNGAAGDGPRPVDAGLTTLALIESRPLPDVLVEMLHTSDDNTAEMLVKEIGYVASGAGTRPAGLEVIRQTLDEWGVPLAGIDLHDGSGLSRGNRATCAALWSVVGESPVSSVLRELLPVAGRDGTLGEELRGTPAEGVLAGKTGSLTDVKALSGVHTTAAGESVEFSVVLNAPDAHNPAVYRPVWEALVALIDGYPVVVEPEADRFAPVTALPG